MFFIRTKYPFLLILLFCLFTYTSVNASDKKNDFEHNLDNYLLYAIKSNPMIEAYRFKSKIQEESITIAKKIPDPKVTAAYFISEIETRVGPQKAKVGLSQMLPWPGKIKSKGTINNSLYHMSKESEVEITANILSSIRSLYAKYFLTGQSIRISNENLKLLKHLESVLLAKYSTGTIKQAALIKIQVEISLIEDKISNLKSRGEIEEEKMRSILNLPNTIDLPFPDALPKLNIETQIKNNSVSDLNPLIQQKEHQKAAAEEKVNLAKKGFIPDLMIMTDYVFTDKVDPLMGNPKDNGKDPWIIGASINLPITVGKKRSEIKKADFELKSIMSSIKNTENKLDSDLIAAKERYHYSIEREKLYNDELVPKSKQVLMLTEENYKNGNSSILDFIDAQRMVLNLEIALINEQVKRELAASEIDKLYGGFFTKRELAR